MSLISTNNFNSNMHIIGIVKTTMLEFSEFSQHCTLLFKRADSNSV